MCNPLVFLGALLITLLIVLYYTKTVKEGFFEVSKGSIVILDGTASIGNGFSVYVSENTEFNNTIVWKEIPGGLSTISITPALEIFGTDTKSNIFYKTNTAPGWSMIPGNLTTIDADGTTVCGITPNGAIACAKQNEAISGNWTIIGDDAKGISVSGDNAYIVLTNNGLGYANISNLNDVKWEFIPVTYVQFHSVSLDGEVVVGINKDNQLMYADENIFSNNPNFTKVTINPGMGQFINVSLQNKTIVAVDMEGTLWYASNYKAPNWIKLNNKSKTVMASQYIPSP